MPEFLDLDSVKKPLGTFLLNGKEYDVHPIKIRNVINLTVMEESLQGDNNQSMEKQMEAAMDLLGELIPSIPKEELEGLTLDQFNALMQWVQGFGDEAVKKNFQKPRKTTRR